jgi:8-oxo-dGTP diphosphatase
VSAANLPYRIAVLVFLEDISGRHLLMLRAKPPNQGIWSPIGGKLETATGESPHECAVRETREETRHEVTTADLHLFGMIAEKAYEGQSHWLLFLSLPHSRARAASRYRGGEVWIFFARRNQSPADPRN